MRDKLSGAVLVVMLAAACGRGSMSRDQKNYETVQEGSANGVTSTIQGPGETLPPITGTASDATTAFAFDPNAYPNQPPTAVATTSAPTTSTAYATPAYPTAPVRRPPPAQSAPPVRTTPAEPAPEPEPEPEPEPAPAPAETTEPEPEPPAPATDTTSTEEPPPPPPNASV